MPPAEEKLQHPSSIGWPWIWTNTKELWISRPRGWSNVRFIDSGFVDGQILDNIIQLQRNILFPGQIYDLRFLIPGGKKTLGCWAWNKSSLSFHNYRKCTRTFSWLKKLICTVGDRILFTSTYCWLTLLWGLLNDY